MKYILTTLVALSLAAPAFADCGKKAASTGKIEKFDAATKTLTVAIVESSDPKEVESKKATLTLTPDSKVIAEGKVDGVKVEALVGKNVTVVSEHGKIEYVISLAAKG
ncbi:MAG: hypothetical protein ACR2OZ_15790 [Verrucomicrobiales bacterium]